MKLIILFLLLLSSTCSYQSSDFSYYYSPRFVKVIGLGNAYTGKADGVETMFFNPAGLAYLNKYEIIYSHINFYPVHIDYIRKFDYDFAFAFPISEKADAIGFSMHHNSSTVSSGSSTYSRIYSLVYARKFSENFSIAINLNLHHLNVEDPNLLNVDLRDLNFKLFNSGLSVLYKINQLSFTG